VREEGRQAPTSSNCLTFRYGSSLSLPSASLSFSPFLCNVFVALRFSYQFFLLLFLVVVVVVVLSLSLSLSLSVSVCVLMLFGRSFIISIRSENPQESYPLGSPLVKLDQSTRACLLLLLLLLSHSSNAATVINYMFFFVNWATADMT
jgi:hypothetical protein